jgi:hypothetical protein
MTDMKQIVRVRSAEFDGDEDGNEWQVEYVLFETHTDGAIHHPTPVYQLYDDDGRGNGSLICTGTSLKRMRSLILRLGQFVEWEAPS